MSTTTGSATKPSVADAADHGPDDLGDAFEKAFSDMGKATVLVVGATGAGKSTLINAFFVGEPAKTGTGRPVTEETTRYDLPNGMLSIYDTKGIEFGHSRERITAWLRKEADRTKIDVAWFCIRAADARVDETQLHMINTLKELRIPVIVVLTQVQKRNGQINPETIQFAESVEHDLQQAGARALVLVASKQGWSTPEPHGLRDLLDETRAALGDGVARDPFEAVQAIDWEAKRRRSRQIVAVSAASAAAVAAAPVPLSDSAGIVPVQLGMVAAVAATYGIPANAQKLAAIAAPVLVGGGVVYVGKALFKGLLKMIPGANVAVGVVAAGVAGSMTYALGEGWMWACEHLSKEGVDDDTDVNFIRAEFRRNYERVLRLNRAA